MLARSNWSPLTVAQPGHLFGVRRCGCVKAVGAQLLAAEAGVADDRGEGSSLEFVMQWHDKCEGAVGVLGANVAAALAGWFPARFARRGNQLRTREDREPLAYAEIGSVRQTMPVVSGWPSSRSLAM